MNQIKTLAFTALAALAGLAAAGQTPAGPWVYNGGVPVTPPVTAFAATAAQAANAVTANNGLPPFETSWMTNNITEWWSADTIGATNNQLLTSWTGHYGNSVTGNCVYVSQVPTLGRPGLFFDNSGSMLLTNNTLLGFSYTNSATVICVYTLPVYAYNDLNWGGHMVFCGSTAWNTYAEGYLAMYVDGSYLNLSARLWAYYNGSQSGVWPNPTEDAPMAGPENQTVVYIVSWTTTNSFTMRNGKVQQLYPNGAWATAGQKNLSGLAFAGNLGLGGLVGFSQPGYWPLDGYIEEFLLSSNSINLPTGDQVSNYFMQKYGLLKDQIIFSGDSLTEGPNTTWSGNITALAQTNFPGWLVINDGIGGSDISGQLTNSMSISQSSTLPDRKIALLWPTGINEINHGFTLSTFTNDVIAEARNYTSNGIRPILVIPESSATMDPYQGGTYRSNYITIMSNAWPSFASAVVNLSQDPVIGQSNDWTSTTYWGPLQDGSHMTNSGYAEAWPYFQAAINYVAYGITTFTGNTNQPPPWLGLNWTCFCTNHVYDSLGGSTWTLIK